MAVLHLPVPSHPQEDLPKGPMECEMQQHSAPTVPALSGPHCVVEFPFEAAGPGELSLSKGDMVELLEKVGDDWFKGRLAGIEGIFPTNFVNVVIDLPPGGGAGGGVDTPTLGPNMAAAVADFEGMEGELSFKVWPGKCHSSHTVHAILKHVAMLV